MAEKDILQQAESSLSRIQTFEAERLVRRDELGASFEFSAAVQPANRLIALFQKLSTATLDQFPDQQLSTVIQAADSVYNLLENISSFDPSSADAISTRQTLIENLRKQYQPAFTNMFPLIAYSVARTADFGAIADQGRAAVQSVEDRVAHLVDEITNKGQEASRVLEEVRKTAAERGVSQEAFHFSKAADEHGRLASDWEKTTKRWAAILGVFAFASVFFHRIPWIAPSNSIEASQYIVSKILIFGVLAYMLGLSAKNYLSHKHNEIVNRHRQNALMTYQSLANASADVGSRGIILQQAATAIYQLHDTGYVKSHGNSSSIAEFLPRSSIPVNVGGSAGG